MTRVRSFGLVALFAALALGNVTQAQAPAPGPMQGFAPTTYGAMLLEQLVRHSDNLVTAINLTRANGFGLWAQSDFIQEFSRTRTWYSDFYGRVLEVRHTHACRVANTRRIKLDYVIGNMANDFRMETIRLYEFYTQVALLPGGQRAVIDQWRRVNFTYLNALSATYYYIEALRRGYYLAGAPNTCRDRRVLEYRLRMMNAIACELRQLMMRIRFNANFPVAPRPMPVEYAYRDVNINVVAPTPNDTFQFPFAEYNPGTDPVQVQQPYAPPGIAPQPLPPTYQFQYNPTNWGQRQGVVDQGYMNPGAVTTPPPVTVQQGQPFTPAVGPQQPPQGGQPGGQPGPGEQPPRGFDY